MWGVLGPMTKGKARFYSKIQAAFHGDLPRTPSIPSDLVHRIFVVSS